MLPEPAMIKGKVTLAAMFETAMPGGAASVSSWKTRKILARVLWICLAGPSE